MKDSLAQVLRLVEGGASTADWREALTSFVEEHDVQPTPSYEEGPKAEMVGALINLLCGDAQAEWDGGTIAVALHALRVVARAGMTKGLEQASLLRYVGKAAGLASEGLRAGWGEISKQASLLLSNLLIVCGERSVEMLRTELGGRTLPADT